MDWYNQLREASDEVSDMVPIKIVKINLRQFLKDYYMKYNKLPDEEFFVSSFDGILSNFAKDIVPDLNLEDRMDRERIDHYVNNNGIIIDNLHLFSIQLGADAPPIIYEWLNILLNRVIYVNGNGFDVYFRLLFANVPENYFFTLVFETSQMNNFRPFTEN